MTAVHELDALLEQMLPAATELAVCVRDRDRAGVHKVLGQLLDPPDTQRLAALSIVLAAMVPIDDAQLDDLLEWSHGPFVSPDDYDQLTAFNPRPGMKRCARCREWWRLEEFNADCRKADGKKTRCRSCLSEVRLERLAAAPVPEAEVVAAATSGEVAA